MMKTLDQVIEEKLSITGREALTRSPLAELMLSLQEYWGLNIYDKQTVEDKILDFRMDNWNDRQVLRYLEIDPQRLANKLDPLQTEQECATFFCGTFWSAQWELTRTGFRHN